MPSLPPSLYPSYVPPSCWRQGGAVAPLVPKPTRPVMSKKRVGVPSTFGACWGYVVFSPPLLFTFENIRLLENRCANAPACSAVGRDVLCVCNLRVYTRVHKRTREIMYTRAH